MSTIRVLQIFGEPFSNGGQDSYIMNMYRHIDRQRVQFDFFTPFCINNTAMKAEVESLGGHMDAAGAPFNVDNNRYFRQGVAAYLQKHQYAIIHIHSGSTYALAVGARLARKSGAKAVIVHSHCGGFANFKYRVIRLLSRHALMTYPTAYYGCSHLAARWKFPAPIIRKQQYTVLKNAVDTTDFHFDPILREQYRKELSLEDKLVIGHVGRFCEQKNHKFLIEIFAAIAAREPNARLVLIGYGNLEDAVRQQVTACGLEDRVLFLGIRHDVAALMNAFDVFLLPSLFEGLPVVGVEAQATGLPVVTSTGVTPELPLENLAQYLPLGESPDYWAQRVIAAAHMPRRDTTQDIIEAGYDVATAAAIMQHRYEEMG